MITLRQLQYFIALGETLHFGRAAELCGVTQPALSTQIRGLEETLGVRLVERRPGSIVLTVEGGEIVRRGRDILAAVRDLADSVDRRDRVLAGPLRLGAIPSIAPYLLPRALPLLSERFPDLDLSLRETVTAALVGDLIRAELDVLLVALPIVHGDIETLEMFEDRFLLAMPADPAGEAVRSPVPLSRLARERVLLLEEGHCLRDQALSVCQMVAPEMLTGFGASSLTTLTQMVANRFGVTLLPEMAVAAEVHRGLAIGIARFEPPEPARRIGLAWRRTSPRRRDFQALADLLIEVHDAASDRIAQPPLSAEPIK